MITNHHFCDSAWYLHPWSASNNLEDEGKKTSILVNHKYRITNRFSTAVIIQYGRYHSFEVLITSFHLFRGYKGQEGLRSVFLHQDTEGFLLLFLQQGLDGVKAQPSFLMCHGILTTCWPTSTQSAKFMPYAWLVVCYFYLRFIREKWNSLKWNSSKEKAFYFRPPTMPMLGQTYISARQNQLPLGDNKNLLNSTNSKWDQRKCAGLSFTSLFSSFVVYQSIPLLLVLPLRGSVTLCSYWVILFPYLRRRQSLFWSPGLFGGWSCYGLFL